MVYLFYITKTANNNNNKNYSTGYKNRRNNNKKRMDINRSNEKLKQG